MTVIHVFIFLLFLSH